MAKKRKEQRFDVMILLITLPFNFFNIPCGLVNLLTPTSDQDTNSPYNINTVSSRQVMRINKNIN